MNTNPFQDPSVSAGSISKENTPIAGHSAMTFPEPVPMPSLSTVSPSVKEQPVLPPGSFKPTEDPNLMEEIGNSIKATNSSNILKAMRLINIILSIGTVAAGFLSWFFGYATTFDEIIASIYIILFGGLLLAFELRNENMDKTIQLNFGFMYGYKTRTVFLVFVAIWPLSMGNHWITLLDAICLFLNAFFNLYVIYHHPDFSGSPPPYHPPSPYQPSNTNPATQA